MTIHIIIADSKKVNCFHYLNHVDPRFENWKPSSSICHENNEIDHFNIQGPPSVRGSTMKSMTLIQIRKGWSHLTSVTHYRSPMGKSGYSQRLVMSIPATKYQSSLKTQICHDEILSERIITWHVLYHVGKLSMSDITWVILDITWYKLGWKYGHCCGRTVVPPLCARV